MMGVQNGKSGTLRDCVRPLFKNPRPNYKSSRLQDCSACREPEIPRLLFTMPRFRDWADIFQDASLSHRPFYTPYDRQLSCHCMVPHITNLSQTYSALTTLQVATTLVAIATRILALATNLN